MSKMGEQMIEWSHLGDSGVTGLKLATDDESMMMDGYIKLPDAAAAIRIPEEDKLSAEMNDASIDEDNDEDKYHRMAVEARRVNRPDIGLVLDILSREEANHREILEAMLPESGLQMEPDFVEPDTRSPYSFAPGTGYHLPDANPL